MSDLQRAKDFTYTAEAATWSIWCASVVVFILRSVSCWVLKSKTTLADDILIVGGWMLAVCRQAFYQRALTSVRYIQDNNYTATVPPAAFWLFFADYWFFISSLFPKVGIGILLVRLFEPRKSIRWAIWFLCFALCVLGIVGFFISLFYCSPPSYQWDPYAHPHGHCWSEHVVTVYTIVFAVSSAIVDIAFAVYPGIIIWTLKRPKWKKLSASAMMSLGFISAVLCLIKLIWLIPIANHSSIYDKLHYGTFLGMFCSMENDIVVAAYCLPFTPAVFRAFTPRVKHYSKHLSLKMKQKTAGSQDTLVDQQNVQQYVLNNIHVPSHLPNAPKPDDTI